jgi:16S rRNA (cytosine967-C5)-methyltransferase
MKMAGRVQAAIDVLHEVLSRSRPAAECLKDWGKAHRFAGSGDRHAIGTLVYDGLRQRLSAGAHGGGDQARNIVLGVLRSGWNLSVEDIAALSQEQHGPQALTPEEKAALQRTPQDLAASVAGNYPAWLAPTFEKLFGENAMREGAALANRAPVDLRVNTLKCERAALQTALASFNPQAGPFTQTSLRIAAPSPEQKHINVEVEPAHGMGWFEVQDTASQIAAHLTGVKPGETVADICAGSGGKTLALAALMKNQGRLIAHDVDRHRLRPIFERITRSGAICIDVLAAGQGDQMQPKSFDCVVVDAPCSGTGTWRRKPEIKWKLTRKTLDAMLSDQRKVLERGAALVRKGGRLCYFTCSVLPEENTDQIKTFLAANRDFKVIPYKEQWRNMIGPEPPASADASTETLLLTPRQHNTDGFYVAIMQRTGG